MTHLYYRVPSGTASLRVDVDAAKRRVAVSIMRPDTRNVSGIRSSENPGKVTYAVPNPAPGVWEVRLQDVDDTRVFDWQQAKKTEPVPPTAVTLTVSALATDLGAALASDGTATSGTGSSGYEVQLTNRLAAFPGAAVSVAAGSAHRELAQLVDRQQKVYDVDVPPGSTMLLAKAGQLSDPRADLDLYLFDCTGKECVASKADGDAIRGGEESVMVLNPAAGKWKVVVDAAEAGKDGVTFSYEDIVLNPAAGYVGVTDQAKTHDARSTWTTRVNAWMSGNVPTGRSPFAALLIQAQPKGAEPFLVGVHELHSSAERASRPDR
jgi:hypothetical protein